MTKPLPSPAEIKAARKALGFSIREFDELVLGAPNADGRVTQALEVGARNGRPFHITPASNLALQRLRSLKVAYEMLLAGDRLTALEALRMALPERLR